MANEDEFFINLEVSSSLPRFDMSRFMEWTDNYDPITAHFITTLRDIPQGGFYQVRGEDYRPDLLSYRIYGDTQYWWILMSYNGLTLISEIITGLVLKYPLISDVEDAYFSLKAKETTRSV